ncbi:MAG: head-tail adaptor protein [Aggregatilineales bacterium]
MPLRSRMQAIIERRLETFLNQTCDIQREDDARGEYGERIHIWTTVASAVACRVVSVNSSSTSSESAMSGRQETIVDTYKLILPNGTTVGVDYRVIVGGQTFDVVNVFDRWTDRMDTQVLIKRARGEDVDE